MKLEIISTLTAAGFRVVKAKAVIYPSVKLGISRKYQKTWTVRTLAPEFVARENKSMFEAEAARWQSSVMAKIAKDNEWKMWCEKQKEKCESTTNGR